MTILFMLMWMATIVRWWQSIVFAVRHAVGYFTITAALLVHTFNTADIHVHFTV